MLKRMIARIFHAAWNVLLAILEVVFRCVPGTKPVWLVCERGDDACDNGLWFFRYLQENYPEINSKYVITASASDRKNLEPYRTHVLTLPSFKLFYYLIKSECILSAHFRHYRNFLTYSPRINSLIVAYVSKKKTVRLQHGITTADLTRWLKDGNFKTDLFVCGAKPELEYLKTLGIFDSSVYRYTGFARFDGLVPVERSSTQILMMPTWRRWLNNEADFLQSQYFSTYKALLRDPRLQSLLHSHDLRLVFYIHPQFKQYTQHFQSLDLPRNIVIADSAKCDLQTLLRESSMMVTDYSSAAFDMAYMYKPICYFMFDEKEYRSKHFAAGYYDYRLGLGLWATTIEELLSNIETYVHNGMAMLDIHRKRTAQFFTLSDRNNCKRIYQETINMLRQ